MKHWKIIADNLSEAGWSWGCVSAIASNGRTIWIADAHRDDGKRFVVRADEKLTAFIATRISGTAARIAVRSRASKASTPTAANPLTETIRLRIPKVAS
jgi:hypothetical protein